MTRRTRTEEAMQAALVLWARNDAIKAYPILQWLYHTPNGGARNPVVAGQMTALGVQRGVPDLLLPAHTWAEDSTDNGPYWIGFVAECKTDTGALTPEQVRWMTHYHREGWQTHVIRTLEEGKAALTAYATGSRAHEPTLWKPGDDLRRARSPIPAAA
jgi:hypothetical protein